MSIRIRPSLAVLAALAFLPGCQRGGSSGGGTTAAASSGTSLEFLVKDSPVDGLASLEASITSVVLVDAQSTAGANLLAEPVDVEFLGLQERSAWLGKVDVPAGTYTEVLLDFDPASIAATAEDGRRIQVNVIGSQLACDLRPTPLAGPSHRLLLDLDVAASLEYARAAGVADFHPVGSLTLDPAGDLPVFPLIAVFHESAGDDLLVRVVRWQRPRGGRGLLRVSLDSGTLLEDESGQPRSEREFRDLLVPQQTLLEIHGELVERGGLRATRLQVAPDFDRSMRRVVLEGLIVGEVPGSSFDLLIQFVLRGRAAVDQALQGNPRQIIELQFHRGTRFYDARHQPISQQDLEIGQRIRARFDAFQSAPFVADEVVLVREEPSGAATVVDTALAPARIIVRYDPQSAAVLSGQIQSADQDVEVDLTVAVIELEGATSRPLSPDQLQPGMLLRIFGGVAGSPAAPTVQPSRVIVRTGRIEGCVTAIDPASATIDVRVSRVLSSPGGAPQASYRVQLARGTEYRGQAGSAAELYRRFNNLAASDKLEVFVNGIQRPGTRVLLADRVVSAVVPRLSPRHDLWPPDHRLVTLDLGCDLDLRDPRGHPLTVRVLAITQDEPVNGRADGNTAPDGFIDSASVVRLRAERAGTGNGRVYRVAFQTTDGSGQTARDFVEIRVPKSRNGRPAIDDGQQYDSTRRR